MDYYNKYKKYKVKYLSEKNKLMNFTNTLRGGEIKYTCKTTTHKHFCDTDTENYNLCATDETICNKLDYNLNEVDIPKLDTSLLTSSEKKKIDEDIERAYTKGYVDDNLSKSCLIQTHKINKYNYKSSQIVPDKFSIMTLNAMGIYRGNEHVLNLMKVRMDILRNFLVKNKPDIMCFQEMSPIAFELLYTNEIEEIYPFFYEKFFNNSVLQQREKDIEVFIITKYPLKKVTIVPLEGNLSYTNSLGIYEYENLIIFNVYMQAGSENSIGQKHKWHHYSRCRSQQLLYIKKEMDKYSEKAIVVLGDFNFDINGTGDKWPERVQFDKLRLNDSWLDVNGHNDMESGLTENTDINSVRYNSKFEEKKYRYDAIMYSNELIPVNSNVVCNEPVPLNSLTPLLNESYEKSILPKKIPDGKSVIYSRISTIENKVYDMFVSDHFGVMSEFRFKNT